MIVGRNVIGSLIVVGGLLSLWPSFAAAQATVNPTRALFNPSPDHNATDAGGTPLVESYQLGLYIVGASQPFQTVSLGKPNPDGTGTVIVDMAAAFIGWPIVGTPYTADVAAVGPGGVARSALSNTFSFTGGGTCSFAVSATSQNAPATGGPSTTTVTTTSGCAWTGQSNVDWITLTSGGSGTANGTVAYTVAANPSTIQRTGTLTIAGWTVTVAQAGGACNFTLSPTSQSVPADGGPQTATVTTSSGCAWTGVSNNTTWITVTSGSSGTGNGTVTYNIAARTATSSRTGTLTIAGQTLTITQSGGCSFTLSTSQTATAAGGPLTNAVTTSTGCMWTTVSNVAWIKVTSSASVTGNGTAGYTVASNTSPNPRTGTLTIAGRMVTVTQSGATTALPVAPANVRVAH